MQLSFEKNKPGMPGSQKITDLSHEGAMIHMDALPAKQHVGRQHRFLSRRSITAPAGRAASTPTGSSR